MAATQPLRAWLLDFVADTLGCARDGLDTRAPLTTLGLSSLEGITLARRLGQWLGRDVASTLVWDHPSIDRIVDALTGEPGAPAAPEASAPGRPPADAAIACIGLACRFPGAPSKEAYWDLLVRGADGVTEVPRERWAIDAFYNPDPGAPGRIASRRGGFLDDLRCFDPAFFGLTPREACSLDPRQRLALETAWEALEDAGLPPRSLAGSRTGVFMATLSANFGDTLFTHYLRAVDAYAGSGSGNSVVANRLSYTLDLRGPSVAVDTACSGSLVAVHLACQALRRGECDTALVGGVNVILRPDDSVFFTKTGALAPDGRCKPFDRRANGIVRSEGVGVIVLRTLERSLADGDRSYAVIRGTAVNHSGATNGIMSPSSRAQAALIREACVAAAVAPGEVQYVEAHGTGTPIGDPIEAAALGEALGQAPGRAHPLRLGSVKGNIGHTEAAAGMAGLIKAMLGVHHRALPASAGFEAPNPLIQFEALGLEVNREHGPWPRPDRPLIAGVSSFGFSGTNAHVIVAEPPTPQHPGHDGAAGPHLLPISAHSAPQLELRARAYAALLRTHDAPPGAAAAHHDPLGAVAGAADDPLGAVAGAAAVHRDHLGSRVAIVADSAAQASAALDAFAAGHPDPDWVHVERPLVRPRLVFVCSGQGSHWLGMGRDLARREPLFQRVLQRCDELLRPLSGWSLLAELDAPPASTRLHETSVMQPAIVAIQIAVAALLRQWGVVPDAVVGQSLGEVAAAHIAGALSLQDALRVVFHRGQLMQRTAGHGATGVVGLGPDELRRRLAGHEGLELAGTSSPAQCVVAGPPGPLHAWLRALADEGVFARPLPVDVAFHSALLDPFLEPLRAALTGLRPLAGRVPFYSTVTGGSLPAAALDADYWVRNLRQPFQLPPALAALGADGHELFLELSPHPVLQDALRACLPRRDGPAPIVATLRRDRDGHRCMQEAMARLYAWGATIDWRARHPERAPQLPLPRTTWDRARFWFDQLPHAEVPSGFEPATGAPWVGAALGDGHPLLGAPRTLAHRPRERVWFHALQRAAPPWLRDHGVGGEVLLPAAAIVIAAACAARELFGSPAVELRDLRIERGLAIGGDAPTRVQIVCAPQPDGHHRWELFAQTGDAAPWQRHAHAELRALPAGSPDHDDHDAPPDDPDAPRDPITLVDHFARMSADGLVYGPAFRTLQHLEAASGRVWAALELQSEGLGDRDSYPIHPTLLDGAIQSTRHLARDADAARLPVGLARARFFAAAPVTRARCRVVGGGPIDPASVLHAALDVRSEQGAPLVRIEGLQLAPVAGAGARALRPEELSLARAWDPQPMGPLWRAGPSCDGFRATLKAQIAAWSDALDLAHHARQWPTLEALATRHIELALRALGWDPRPGDAVAVDALAAQLAVAPRHLRFFARLLQILAEDARLVAAPGGWRVLHAPSAEPAAPLVAHMRSQFPRSVAELGLVQRCGEALADILRGAVDPLELLFADDLLRALYQDAAIIQVYNRIVAEATAAMLPEPVAEATAAMLPEPAVAQAPAAMLPEPAVAQAPARILEIGAGTGATTWHVLQRLPDAGVEYTVTDRSALLAEQAGARFAGDPRVRTGTLDIERAPAAQGLPLAGHDVVIAANVLHATRDLGEALAHVRELLAPGGLLVLLEGAGPQRWLDVIVGGTEGWWRFADARKDHPLLSGARWREVLADAGFERIELHVDPSADPSQVVVLARRPAPPRPDRRWLVLTDRRGVGAALARRLAAQAEPVTLLHPAADGLWRSEEHGDAALSTLLAADDGRELGVVHTRALDLPDAPDLEPAAFDRLEDELELLCALARGLSSAPGAARRRLWVATCGAHRVGERDDPIAALHGPLWGLVRSLFLEHDGVGGALVDLDPASTAEAHADALLRELDPPRPDEQQVAWRGEQRLVARLVRVGPLAPRRELVIRPDASYLITGGLSGIGLATARRLVERGARGLVILARTPLPTRARWDDDDLPAAIVARVAAVRALEARGARVRVLAADVGDERALAAALDRLADEGWPPIRGVVHSAGLIDDHLLVNMTRAALLAVTRPKLRGAWALHRRFGATLDFFVLFSSATSLVGGTLGQGNYAAGNAFLDALARHRAHLGLPVTAINWGIWGGAGIIARSELGAQLERTGLRALTEDEGLDALEYAITRGVAELGIVAVDWDRWRHALPGLAAQPYYARVDPAPLAAAPATPTDLDAALAGLDADQLRAHLRAAVTTLVAGITMQRPEGIDPARPLSQSGLDSIMAVELRYRLESVFGASPSVVDLLRGATIDSVVATMATRHAATPHAAATPPPSGPTLRVRSPVRAVSSLQTAFWSFQQRAPGNPVYSLPFACHLARRIDPAVFAEVLLALVRRHPALRTSLQIVDGRLCQIVPDAPTPPDLAVVDLTQLDEPRAREVLAAEARRWSRIAFDLATAPLLRCTLFQLRDASVVLVNIHHAVVDGWSASVLVHDLDALYSAIAAGKPVDLPAPEITYADFVEWQQERLERGEFAAQLAFWRERLATPAPPLFAPVSPAADRGFPGRQQRASVDADTVRRLDPLCHASGATMFMVMMAGLCAALHRNYGRDALTIGVARSNRDLPALRNVLGCFVNMLGVGVALDDRASFRALVEQVRDVTTEAYAHCDVPFEQAFRAASGGATPPYEAVFVFKTTPTWLPEIVVRVEQLDTGTSKFPLSVDLTRSGDEVDGFFEYDSDRLTAQEAAALTLLFAALLRAAAARPDDPLGALLDRATADLQAPAPTLDPSGNDASERFGF